MTNENKNQGKTYLVRVNKIAVLFRKDRTQRDGYAEHYDRDRDGISKDEKKIVALWNRGLNSAKKVRIAQPSDSVITSAHEKRAKKIVPFRDATDYGDGVIRVQVSERRSDGREDYDEKLPRNGKRKLL